MAEFPALPLWTDAFLADTLHLDATESGAYLLLLIAAWRTPECRIPDDDEILARWSRCGLRTWRRIRPKVLAFWRPCEGGFEQKRLIEERQRAKVLKERARTAANARYQKNNETDADKQSLEPASSLPPTPTPTPSKTLNPTADRRGTSDDFIEGEDEGEEQHVLHPAPGSRASGTNPRANGTSLRQNGTNPRALGTNPRAVAEADDEAKRRAKRMALWQPRLDEFRRTRRWQSAWGPQPSDAPGWSPKGLLVSAELVPEFIAAAEPHPPRG